MKKNKIIIDKEYLKGWFLKKFHSIHPAAFEVYLILCAYSEDDRTSTVSIDTLSFKVGLSRKIIHKILKGLRKANLIRWKTFEGKTTTYVLGGIKEK